MTEEQKAAIAKLQAALARERGITEPLQPSESDGMTGHLLPRGVVVVHVNGARVTIGKRGGFGVPDVSSYRETGQGDSLTCPGTSAFDAALFADVLLAKQQGRG